MHKINVQRCKIKKSPLKGEILIGGSNQRTFQPEHREAPSSSYHAEEVVIGGAKPWEASGSSAAQAEARLNSDNCGGGVAGRWWSPLDSGDQTSIGCQGW